MKNLTGVTAISNNFPGKYMFQLVEIYTDRIVGKWVQMVHLIKGCLE
jgi:hypothetical protein